MADETRREDDDTSKIIVPDSDITGQDEALADNIVFRDSFQHPGKRVAVASKMGVDVCWNCHRPVLSPDSYLDVPMREALMRMCRDESCLISAARELMKQAKPFVEGGL